MLKYFKTKWQLFIINLVRSAQVLQHFLNEVLRPPVHVGDAAGAVRLRDGEVLRLSVHGARRREHHLITVVRSHYL